LATLRLHHYQASPDADERALYERSTLTRVLGPSLNRNSKLLMIANVSADERDLQQTLHTLAFASAVKEIKTDARPRRAPKPN
jgi:hypothetical protein